MIGRIYRLQCNETSKFYIGSTIHTLTYRLKKHRSTSKEEDKMGSPLYTHFRSVGWNNAEMILIYECEVNNRLDLLKLEKDEILKYIGQENCLNHNRPIRTTEEKKEWDKEYGKVHRILKRDQERSRVNQWRLDNPEKYAEQRRRANEREKEKRSSQKTI
jgi:hypothetical protein